MITAMREWLTGIVGVTLLLSAAQTFIPDGSVKQAASLISGLVLLLAILRPVLETDLKHVSIEIGDYETAIEEAQKDLKAENQRELKELIETRTGTYILDKAETLGLSLNVSVRAEENADGIPVPALVELEGTPSVELSQWLEQELGLGAERQVWNGGKN